MARRRVGAIAEYKARLRELKRARAKGLEPSTTPRPSEKTVTGAIPAPPGRYWWQEKDEDTTVSEPEVPRPAPYDGEPFKVTAEGLDGVRRLWAWTRKPEAEALAIYGPAIRAASMYPFYETVRNRKTGV